MAQTDWIEKEVHPLTGGHAFHAPIEQLSLADALLVYAMADFAEAEAKKRKDAVKKHLMALAEAHGEADPEGKGHKTLSAEGSTVVRQRKQASAPNEDKLKELLKGKGVPILDVFEEIKVLQFNPSKLEHLVNVGSIEKGTIDALREVSFACLVTTSPQLKEALNAAKKPLLVENGVAATETVKGAKKGKKSATATGHDF